jgi:transcriptional regulator with XRE-family HTH domain
MGKGCMKDNDNTYFRARKKAAEYNERLSSRESASELLGVSQSTLSDYELGITKVIPVDKVVLMADLYRCPELLNQYCKNECPIGKTLPIATKAEGIEGIALRMIRQLDTSSIEEIKSELIDISADGRISEDELPVLKTVMEKLENMQRAISEVQLIGKKLIS